MERSRPDTASRPVCEYDVSVISLWSYVGSCAFRTLAEPARGRHRLQPVDLLAVFAAGGGKPVKERPLQRNAYRIVEMRRWPALRGIPLVLHPRFYPADPSLAHRVLLGAIAEGGDVADAVHPGSARSGT